MNIVQKCLDIKNRPSMPSIETALTGSLEDKEGLLQLAERIAEVIAVNSEEGTTILLTCLDDAIIYFEKRLNNE